MFTVACTTTVHADEPLSREEVSDLIEKIVDEIDRLGCEVDVSTTGVGHEIVFEVSVDVDEEDDFEALHRGFSAIRCGFHAAEIGTARMTLPAGIDARLRRTDTSSDGDLQPA